MEQIMHQAPLDEVLRVAETLKYGRPCLPISISWEWKHPDDAEWTKEERNCRIPPPFDGGIRDLIRDHIYTVAARDGLEVKEGTIAWLPEGEQ
jgi:hypothetical protein